MRIWVPIVAVVLGVMFAAAMLFNARSQAPSTPAQTTATQPAEGQAEASTQATTGTTAGTDAQMVPTTAPTQPATMSAAAVTAIEGLHVVEEARPLRAILGRAEEGSAYRLQVDLAPWGAGVERITLSDYRRHVDAGERYVISAPLEAGGFRVYPFAARSIRINGQRLDVQAKAWALTESVETENGSEAEYRLSLADGENQPVVELVRRYVLAKDSYDLTVRQQIISHSEQPLQVVWEQNIQGDVTKDDAAYLGDRRMFATGYFRPSDPGHFHVYVDKGFLGRDEVIKSGKIWPNPKLEGAESLVWLGSENRYFAVVTHPVVPPTITTTQQVPALAGEFSSVGVVVFPKSEEVKAEFKAVVLTAASAPLELAAGGVAELDLSVYAGPRKKEIFEQFPYSVLEFTNLIRYELGCTWCTFQPLAKGLLAFLKILHAGVRDWGVAIIILVAVVRLLLHPITKKAQVNMMKMGKQMQTLQPEMAKLKEKYKNDQTKLNQETMKLYREKGVNPANMLGCLPMFLQMPIWVALYAMLYFAIELRHEPAFYGLFQAISGGHWSFLADLSTADNFIKIFDTPRKINLYFMEPNFQSINLLPLLMAVVFYFQQKLTTPPPANEQAAQQQKMMKFMVLLFPFFLYSAPSGLTLYILASTGAGIMDSYLVRKHVREQEEAGTLFDKKPRKPGGLVDRLQKAMEERQRQMAAHQGKRGGKADFKRRKKS